MFGEGLVLIGVDCDVVDVVMSRRLGDTDMLEVFKQMAGIARSFKEYCGEVEGGVMEDG
ncbi:MAG: hypothetical protein LZ167_08125 [Thaumarchaeota archaeon]|jgi:hypothetical protein|nr:hypothetical protein [Candidatus Geocrenenecus arthurdayi]